jgi:hypothetical protein
MQNMERQNLKKYLPADIWESLQFLAPGYGDMEDVDHPHMQASLKVGFDHRRVVKPTELCRRILTAVALRRCERWTCPKCRLITQVGTAG